MAKNAPIQVVDIEEAVAVGGNEPAPEGVRFCFNSVQLFKFEDGTSYHAAKQRAIISDEKLIANLTEAAKNKSNFIFIES